MSVKPVIDSCKSYHDATSYHRYHMVPHQLNWSDVPKPTKDYSGLETLPLQRVQEFPEASLWGIVKHSCRTGEAKRVDFQALSAVLLLGYGITATQRTGGGIYRFRSVPSAGALFPAEVYSASPEFSGHSAGLDYYDPESFTLSRLGKEAAFLQVLSALPSAGDPQRQASFLLSGIFYRSAWKYRQRAFRYVMLDVGHLIENLVLALRFCRIPGEVHYDFNDRHLNRLLGLDTQREACFACVNWGGVRGEKDISAVKSAAGTAPLSERYRQAGKTAAEEIFYSEISDIRRITSQPSTSSGTLPLDDRVTNKKPLSWYPVVKTDEPDKDELPFAETVRQRRSRRNFARTPLPLKKFMRLLDLMCEETGSGGPSVSAAAGACLTTGFLAGRVEGMDPGFYVLSGKERAYGVVEPGWLLDKMAHACLDQLWLKFAAVHFLFMANLRDIDEKIGARGYRYALMNAGRLGHRLYLGAAAMRLGCCGIGALYDGEARAVLSLNADSVLLYLVAVGPLTTPMG